jgi:hypothetical protein
MVKKLGLVIATGLVSCFTAGVALAVPHPDNGPGCGLGKVAWEGYANPKDMGAQLLMSTTNNTILPWQAFGITSQTLGCTNNGKLFSEYKTTLFAQTNFENLSQEMAQGQGEHLASLATLMGVPSEHHAEFFALTQEHYTTLVQSGNTTPGAMLAALDGAMAGHPVLAKLSTNR